MQGRDLPYLTEEDFENANKFNIKSIADRRLLLQNIQTLIK